MCNCRKCSEVRDRISPVIRQSDLVIFLEVDKTKVESSWPMNEIEPEVV